MNCHETADQQLIREWLEEAQAYKPSSKAQVLDDIKREYDVQNGMRGTAFDDRHTANDVLIYIARYSDNVAFAPTPEEWRKQMVKVAALAVSALVTFDRDGGPAGQYRED